MEQYKSNSHKSKAEARNNEKRVEKVVKGKVKTKHKKGISKKIRVLTLIFYAFYPPTIPDFHGFFNVYRSSSFIKRS